MDSASDMITFVNGLFTVSSLTNSRHGSTLANCRFQARVCMFCTVSDIDVKKRFSRFFIFVTFLRFFKFLRTFLNKNVEKLLSMQANSEI